MSANYNKFKSTTVYGDFNNKDIDQNNTSNANAIFDRNVLVKGTLQSNDCSFNTIKINGNITSNLLTITPTEISFLKDASSNIQTQINNISTNYLLISSLPSYNYATKNYVGAVVSAYTTTIDLNANYVSNSSLATQLNNYCL